ncbi:glycosyltransferase family 4 protein [Patescibacteria group bacterium]|nr:glycosyltransferase family 4 protein [Patescibacteria group bacterium]
MSKVYVFDPTASDKLSFVRGVGRYLQILKENFPDWTFTDKLVNPLTHNSQTILINPFFNFLQKPVTMRRVAKKQIAVIHDLIPLKYPRHFPAGFRGNLNILFNRFALQNYDLVVTDSETSKKNIIDILGLPESKIKVIYPCLPKSFLKIEKGKFNKNGKLKIENFCLYVGDATWNKNLINLVKAIKIINVTCIFAGKVFEKLSGDFSNAWQKDLNLFISETKDDKRFVFAGFVSDNQLIKLYQQARLNVMPSRDEGFGFSFLEAGNFGCPSVSSDTPVFNEVSQGNSLFFDPENPNDIADKIGEIYFNKELRNSFGQKAKKRSEFFSEKKFQKDFLNLI